MRNAAPGHHRGVLLVAFVCMAGHLFNPGPMAFAGGSTVSLADYQAADPTGVPAELVNADQVKRGEYLARAADCEVCHTAPGGAAYAADSRFRCRSERFTRPISQPTRRPASAITATPIFSTRCSAVFARTERGFIRPCRIRRTLI